ncbi:MAG: DUF6955 family protein [Thermodesulfobacteriota bacterium]
MGDFLINVFLDDKKMQVIEGAGLAGQVTDVAGKKAIQVKVAEKEQKKLAKGFPDLEIGADNSYVLPAEAETKLLDIIGQMKTLDVMKVAIMKLYNPLAGKAPRSAQR